VFGRSATPRARAREGNIRSGSSATRRFPGEIGRFKGRSRRARQVLGLATFEV